MRTRPRRPPRLSRLQPPQPATTAADLTAVKDYLLEHTGQLTGFTADFAADAQRYYDLAEAANFDYEALWQSNAAEVGELVEHMKEDWVEGNPYYERMEGIVAGTPSLAEYDVIIDAGSSAAEDPASAVPFDLTLPDGRVLEQPGNFYNLTEGALWGTLPDALAAEVPSTPTDLDGDGTVEFGEVLPDAAFLNVAATEFQNTANDLAGRRRRVAAGRFRCVHGARRHGSDDERVLRPVEGVALRGG